MVVAVLTTEEQDTLRNELAEIESIAGTESRKWHKSRPARRLCYLRLVLEKQLASGNVFFGVYWKPVPYFLPTIEVIERALKMKANRRSIAWIFVDGIDRQKAKEITNALRLRDVALERVKGRRDESEPLIRLADMWAGCIRAALEGKTEEKVILDQALRYGWVIPVKW